MMIYTEIKKQQCAKFKKETSLKDDSSGSRLFL